MHCQQPELRLLTLQNEELTTDVMAVKGYEVLQAADYRLAHSPFSGKMKWLICRIRVELTLGLEQESVSTPTIGVCFV